MSPRLRPDGTVPATLEILAIGTDHVLGVSHRRSAWSTSSSID